MSLPIRTERLLLRRFTGDDSQDILDFISHPTVARATPEIEATEEGVQKYIENQRSYSPFEHDKCFDLAVERIVDGKVIGLLTLIRSKHKQGEIGYALGTDFRGRGYATEAAWALINYAFSVLNLHRIHATTTSDNSASYHVMERLDMRREGHMREAVFSDDVWLDVLVYGILAQEWRATIT